MEEKTISTNDALLLQVIEDDPSDNKFLACAVEGKADYIVTGDRHLLHIEEYRGIKILQPRAFLQAVKRDGT